MEEGDDGVSAEKLARKIVEAVLVRLDDHIRRHGLASIGDDLKEAAIAVVAQMIREDREYY